MKQIKKLVFLGILLFSINSIFAQVTEAQVKKDIAKKFPGAISIEVVGSGTNTEEWEGSTKVYYHRRRVKVLSKTSFAKELPNSRAIVEGLAVYTKQGGVYVFKKYNPGYEELTGMPPIDIAKINKFIDENLCEEILLNCNSILGVPSPKIEMKKDSKVTWYSTTSFSFKIDTVIVKRWRNATTIDVELGKAEIRFYRDNMNSEWTRVLHGSGFSYVKLLKTETYKEGELDKMDYLEKIVKDKSLK